MLQTSAQLIKLASQGFRAAPSPGDIRRRWHQHLLVDFYAVQYVYAWYRNLYYFNGNVDRNDLFQQEWLFCSLPEGLTILVAPKLIASSQSFSN
jgi:hypothetical protein